MSLPQLFVSWVFFVILCASLSSFPPIRKRSLQRFAVISFCLAIPGCKLYVREVFSAIAQLMRSSKVVAEVQGGLCSDIHYWRFLDDWSDCLPWRSEKHCIVTLFCNASKRSWGGVLLKDGKRVESRDYWPDSSDNINSLEAKALLHSPLAFRDHIHDSRVDVYTDNQTLKAALESSGCKSSSVNKSVKEILRCSRQLNFAMNVCFVPSRGNPADVPSRVCSDVDCMLSAEAWDLVERSFGPYSFDLISLDSNCRRDRSGRMLPHHSPWHTPASQGINAFAQPIPLGHNIYVFPPFVLVGLLFFSFFRESEVCPVNWISYYLSSCDLLNVRLAPGFFFRTSDGN